MPSAEKAAAATARAAEARRVTSASLTEEELAALLKTKDPGRTIRFLCPVVAQKLSEFSMSSFLGLTFWSLEECFLTLSSSTLSTRASFEFC